MGVDGRVEILLSSTYHIINIVAVAILTDGAQQVNFKQTTVQQMSF